MLWRIDMGKIGIKANVVGLGYVGLPTAIMLAESGNFVTGTDIDFKLIDRLISIEHLVHDEVLNSLLASHSNSSLMFSTVPVEADFHFVAVPTPFLKQSKQIDLSFLINAIDSILTVNQDNYTIVIESTVSPGTIANLKRKYSILSRDIFFVHAPERILPGNLYYEIVHNSRTIGSDDPILGRKVEELYRGFCLGEIISTDIITAELSKVVENTFRDINIAFANEIAVISHEMGVNVYDLIDIANKHPRVNILNPGPGVGGHCIPVDPWFLVGDYPSKTKLIRSAREVNDEMPSFILSRAREILHKNSIDQSRVGIYGLTYKADVSDTRESPSLQLIDLFTKEFGFAPLVYDPLIKDGKYNSQPSFEEFLLKINFVIVMVDHSHLKVNVDKLLGKIIFDTKRVVFLDGVIRL
jgi:UDP-N-acetyl-D-mannosaminuronic acid dehydrogenase